MSFIFNYITYNHIILLIIIYHLKFVNALALLLKKFISNVPIVY